MEWLPPDFSCLPDRQSGKFGDCNIEKYVRTRALQLDNLRIDSRIRNLVGSFSDDRNFCTKTVLEALQVVSSVFVVLVENTDLPTATLFKEIFGIDASLALIIRLPAHCPRKIFRIVPFGSAGCDEKLRYLLFVHVAADCSVRRRSGTLEEQQDPILFHEPASLLERPRGDVGVIVRNECDFATVDSAFRIDFRKILLLRSTDEVISRSRAGIRHDVADLNFGVARP